MTCISWTQRFEKTFSGHMKVKKISEYCRQLKYHQFRIRSEICILLEIILNAFKCLTVSLSTQILILAIATLSFISVSIIFEFTTLLDVYILLSLQEEEVNSSSCGDRCTYLKAHLSKRLNLMSVIIF